ncbi:HAMP domain-containing histidine kinase [Candidatus Gracilibacteria bacterium]|nr:HAMP domain-containing histidine kinase [Candidatus Gracilibacteria bacterium]
MTLSRKFIVSLLLSIFFIAFVNILAFYVFYSSYFKIYLTEKSNSRDEVTIEYINDVIRQQTLDDIDSIFTDTEIDFFELLENNNGRISLNEQKNVDTVINYLVKSGVAPKYIEELIPTDNFGKVLQEIQNKESPEYQFLQRLTQSILIANVISLGILVLGLLIFIKKTISPIKIATTNIQKINPSKKYKAIEYYNKKDEIGLLITSINELNSKLGMQEEIRNRLLADISHELKTPITSIQCYLEGILDGVIKLDQKNLNSITDEMKRLIALVNKIMDYEKSEREKFTLEFAQVNATETMKQIVETHKKRLKENKQRIKITGEEDLYIKADENLFKQLVHNIVGNFLKYAGQKTLLKINITKKYIDFIDDGNGIKSSEVPFLVEKFYQGKKEKTGDITSRGIGVGLSITRKIIYSHDWSYEIESDIGKGFRIKVFI